MTKREADYQSNLIERLEQDFPGCFVMKNDEQYRQGVPDLTVLYGERWAVLEVKRSIQEMSRLRPNQGYYVDKLNSMGFAAFVYPENEEEVFDALQRAFQCGR
jgi:hypothetical protein